MRFTFATATELQRVADYIEGGLAREDFVREQLWKCEACEEHFDDPRDGTSVESTGEWFCDDCMSIGHGRLDREYDRLTARDLGLGAWG